MTLKAVAELANVSIKTASRALSGDGYVSEKTRDDVLQAAKRIGYVPNRAARAMRMGESQAVGLLAHLVASSPFTTDITRAVERTVEEAGKALLIADGSQAQAARSLRLFAEFQVTRFIFATGYHMSAEGLLPEGAAPSALINCFMDGIDAPCFVPDDEGGGHAQARHLAELGHKRIGMIELPEGMVARPLRRRGVDRALAEAGLRLDEGLVRTGQVGPVSARRTVAYEAAMDLLERRDRPTAIICSKDEFALQTLGAAARLGLRVPDDLSVIGFDDVQIISATTRPALTTIRLPYFEMGRRAAQVALAPRDAPSGRQPVACPIVVRDSTAEV